MKLIKKNSKKVLCLILCMVVALSTGCSLFDSSVNDIKGKLNGNSFNCYFYDNSGGKFFTVKGEKIGLTSNVIKEANISSSDGSYSTSYSLSSVVTINVDGNQIQSCGDTVIFEEKGLTPDQEFTLTDIESEPSGKFSENTYISNIVNKYKNAFGKGQVVIIQSQLGNPICAYSGDDVYWEVKDDLPKTTKLMIDGKALYIHRANFQIIDKDLID